MPPTGSQVISNNNKGTPLSTATTRVSSQKIINNASERSCDNNEHTATKLTTPSFEACETNDRYNATTLTKALVTNIPSVPTNNNSHIGNITPKSSCDPRDKVPRLNSEYHQEYKNSYNSEYVDNNVDHISSHNSLENPEHSLRRDRDTKVCKEIDPEQNDTLKILNVPEEELAQNSGSSELTQLSMVDITSERLTRETGLMRDMKAIDVDDVQMQVDESNFSNDDSFMDTCEEQQTDGPNNSTAIPNTFQPNSTLTLVNGPSGIESVSHDKYSDGSKQHDSPTNNPMQPKISSIDAVVQCDIEKSNVPNLQENTSELVSNNKPEPTRNEEYVDVKVPKKVRVVESCSDDCESVTQCALFNDSDTQTEHSVPKHNSEPVSNSELVATLPEPDVAPSPINASNSPVNEPSPCQFINKIMPSENSQLSPAKSINVCSTANLVAESSSVDSISESSNSKSTSEVSSPTAHPSSPDSSSKLSTTIPVSKSIGSPTPAAKVSSPPVILNPDECDWETLYDDDGECLVPDIMNEVSSSNN